MTHDAFHVAASATSAETLLLIERDDSMPALPDARGKWIASKTNSDAERPHADHAVELAVRRSQPCGDPVGIVQDGDGRRLKTMAAQLGRQQFLDPRTLQLRQVRRLFHYTILHQPRHGNADGCNVFRSIRYQNYLF